MSLRSDLLAAAVARRERVLAELADDPELRHIARYEHDLMVDKLRSGKTFRLSRDELPRGHSERGRGRPLDVLALVGDDDLSLSSAPMRLDFTG
ncbi:hypothetical protein Y900_024180 [Mycolicibacterium aromaticivorans JS19b1 = JCM 16368]|uniref:Uncharacterized protein n=1 Tax=Mycolicibacterium aromaticivorans JS19b1 = JCM 16368 TaxID=1440774 RepID=A0A064CNL2_9MYCO|nr:hypothetical protein [Mycolicibacterium aromaticivorans]KDF01941.1 hypothetical protein Y900_024180 [Mycolicibacterium aromaticivorans JS19b1 = JCM 16368]